MAIETRRLGNSELEVGPIAYGCWRFAGTTVSEAREKIETALDNGMNLIDTADIYGLDDPGGFGSSEQLLGQVLADEPSLRDRIMLATKGGIVPGVPYDSSPRYLREACEASLRRLGVDVIDLYQIHRPDVLTHPADVAATLIELRESGKVREFGVSNYSPTRTAALQAHLGDLRLVTTQPELSLMHTEPLDDGTLDQAMVEGLTPLAWSPLGGGRIGDGHVASDLSATLGDMAARESVTPPAIALAWVMAHPSGVIPIIGTTRRDRIAEAALATRVRLSRDDWYSLAAAAGRDLP